MKISNTIIKINDTIDGLIDRWWSYILIGDDGNKDHIMLWNEHHSRTPAQRFFHDLTFILQMIPLIVVSFFMIPILKFSLFLAEVVSCRAEITLGHCVDYGASA